MNTSSTVTVIGGLGLFLLGIHHLTEGLKGLAGDSLRRALQAMVSGRLSAIISGALFTVLIQSSTATTLTVIGFVSAGLVTFSQAVGVIIGATFGRSHSGRLRTALHRDRLSPDRNGRHFVEPRCHRRKRLWLAMDSRWGRDLDVGCHAE